MNEMQVLAEFRAAVAPPEPAALAAARDRVLDGTATGLGGRRAPGPRRRTWPKLALTGLAAAVTAAAVAVVAVVLTAPGSGPSHPGGVNLDAKELAYRVANAAAARPYVRPGQWVYWQEKTATAPIASARSARQGTFEVWTTADAARAAYLANGKVTFFRCGGVFPSPGCQSIGQPVPALLPDGQGTGLFEVTGKMPISYAGLKSLPRSPAALDRYLASLPLRGWGPAPVREFEVIKDLLITYVLPPALTAELYRALGNIPGVTIDRHAVDVAGRTGFGFQITLPRAMGGEIDQLILDPKTYDLMGQQLVLAPSAGAAAGRVLSGTAVLKSALVSGPGITP
jgi:hypothetical protein